MIWFKAAISYVRKWWGYMSGALSVPFALLALFSVSGRLLFAALAYASVWALVISQGRQISRLQARTKRPNIEIYDAFDTLITRGEALMDRYLKKETNLGQEFSQWNSDLIATANLHAKLSERNRLRDASTMDLNAQEAIRIGLNATQEEVETAQNLFAKLKVVRAITERLRKED